MSDPDSVVNATTSSSPPSWPATSPLVAGDRCRRRQYRSPADSRLPLHAAAHGGGAYRSIPVLDRRLDDERVPVHGGDDRTAAVVAGDGLGFPDDLGVDRGVIDADEREERDADAGRAAGQQDQTRNRTRRSITDRFGRRRDTPCRMRRWGPTA